MESERPVSPSGFLRRDRKWERWRGGATSCGTPRLGTLLITATERTNRANKSLAALSEPAHISYSVAPLARLADART